MINFIRRLFGRSAKAPSETRPSWDPQHEGLGEVSGGGSQLDDPYPDGRPRVAFCGIDIDVVDRDRALGTIRHKLIELNAPEGTEVHYTEGTTMLLDRLSNRAWDQRLPRSLKHPGFGV